MADDAFPLQTSIMKTFSKRDLTKEERIFNYRLSRARRISENAFGILANRFKFFLSTISLSPENIEKIILASCVLNNYLRSNLISRYMPPGSVDNENEDGSIRSGDWRVHEALLPLNQQGSNTYSKDAKEIRNSFCRYFNNEGHVSWQDKMV